MGMFGAPGGNVYYDPNNEFARNYVSGNQTVGNRVRGGVSMIGKV